MSWSKVIFLSFSIFAAGFVVGMAIRGPQPQLVGDLGDRLPHPFRPPRPNPPGPEPSPRPLDEPDGRIFERLRGHIRAEADDRASRKIEAFATELGDRLEKMQDDGTLVVGDGEPVQFIGASFLAGAIFAVVKKVVIYIVKALIVAAIVAVFWMYWTWIVGGFTIAVTIIAWPIAFAAAKIHSPKKE